MAGFVQIIEFTTSRFEEGDKLVDEYREKTKGKSTFVRAMTLRDRETPNRYLQVVEFPSYEEAMKNSELPETAALAEALAALSDGPQKFSNMDIVRVVES
jgi:hypothetical protein